MKNPIYSEGSHQRGAGFKAYGQASADINFVCHKIAGSQLTPVVKVHINLEVQTLRVNHVYELSVSLGSSAVRASARNAEGPGFEYQPRQDFLRAHGELLSRLFDHGSNAKNP